jgi:hypothetical protein
MKNIQTINADLDAKELFEQISPQYPLARNGERAEEKPAKPNLSALFLIDVRRKRFIDGFLVSGLFIALVAVACFLILSPFVRWCESLFEKGLP